MVAHYAVRGDVDKGIAGRLSIARTRCAAGIQQGNAVHILVITLVCMAEKRYLCAYFLRFREQHIGAVLYIEPVTVRKKHFHFARVVKIAVRRERIVIAVARYVKYHFLGVNYAQLVYLALAVAQKDKCIHVLISLDDLASCSEIAGMEKNPKLEGRFMAMFLTPKNSK